MVSVTMRQYQMAYCGVIRVLEGGKREDQSEKGMEKNSVGNLRKHKLTDPGNLANPTAG